jgi:two-component system sensor histidine kinase MprB
LVPAPPRLLDLVVVQRLDASGAVVESSGGVSLPVAAEDRALAAHGGPPWLRTETVNGAPYRVVTVPFPAGGAVQVARGLEENDGFLGSLRWRFGLLALLAAALAALAGWLVARAVTAPLERLADTADQVAATGRTDRPVETGRSDEVGRLARAFQSMLDALNRSRRQQHQLVRDAGHELRTPLTSLRSNVDVLRRHRGALPPETVERVLADVDGELRELTSLVDEVVELATDSRASEAVSEVRMEQLAAGVAERAGTRLGLPVALDAQPWTLWGRPRALERALGNLVQNAAKFSPAGSPIEIAVRPGSISVRDRGPGIPPADLPYVFDRFYRSPATAERPGSGLGLSIVRQVAEAHGGQAFAANRPDGGAEVGMHLPLYAAP